MEMKRNQGDEQNLGDGPTWVSIDDEDSLHLLLVVERRVICSRYVELPKSYAQCGISNLKYLGS